MRILAKLKSLLVNNKNKKLRININIEDEDHLFDEILTDPDIQKFWKEIKEEFEDEIDKQELYKVFKFYLFIFITKYALEEFIDSIKMPNLLDNNIGYSIYKNNNLFKGNLDEKTFKKLLGRIWEYHKELFFKNLF
jgi:hypothetical protein